MSFINSDALIHELNGSEQSGFVALHSPLQRLPGGAFRMMQLRVAIFAYPEFNMAALPNFLVRFLG